MQAKARRDTLGRAIAELATEPPFLETVGRLCCLRGVSTLTALALTVELGDWTRFRPQSLGPFLGLTPSEDSGGERRRQCESPRPATHTRPGSSSRLPGISGGHYGQARRSSAADRDSPPRARTSRPKRLSAPPVLARARAAGTVAAVAVARERACWTPATM